MASESIRFNKGRLNKKDIGGQTTPEVYSATQAAVHRQHSTEICRKMTREGFLEGKVLFVCQL